MVRLLLSGKWVALSILVLICAGSFIWLGSWQWSRAYPATTQPAANQQPVPLRQVHTPGQPVSADAVGQNVRVTGKYRSDEQLLVPGRTVGGASDSVGFWVLTPLVL
ncbi:MAG: SURF1 family cytochrome oxidase biogenesis protein, partial [Candidatus Nanopelagicales bacterium]